MKTTPRPNQSDDLQLDSSVLVSSTWEPGTLNLDSPNSRQPSALEELSETDRWASMPSKWGDVTEGKQTSDWNKDACLEFRVRCEGQPTRRLRLSGARYTLGSGVGCSIRLDDSSLRPLHAVLIRDQARVLVRAYSVPMQINDARVTEGTLELHDRLRLGEYEFELLEHTPLPEQTPMPKKSASSIEALSNLSSRQSERSLEMDEWERSFHEEAKHWRALKQDVERRDEWCRSREQEVLEQREWLDRQIELLKKRQDELSTQESAAIEVHDEFSERFDDLNQRKKEIELQQEELDAGREHLRLQQERLDGRDRLHRVQIEKLLSEQDEFRDRNAEQESIIADAENQVRTSQERADAANAAVEQMRLKFASLNEQLLELTNQQESLQRLEADRNQEHQLRCDDLAGSRDEVLAQRDDAAKQRDEAIDAKAASDARREKTLLRCDELEGIEEQLRLEIKQLQEEIASTRNEASQLDNECKSARETIAHLEGTIQTNEERHESDRESWTQEVESLRKNLDDLTLELAGAQSQLSRLREDNDRLAEQLSGAHQDRDDARQKQEAATRECEAANLACEEATAEIVTARRQLAEALKQCDDARQDREQIQAQRDQLNGELKTTQGEHEDWERRTVEAERRYADAQSTLVEARDQWQKAEYARDDAETQRLVAEEKLVEARRELEAMQIERDKAVSNSDDLRRQRDIALEDANQTRALYDRSNRDHDDTLDRIEYLERQTRDAISDPKKKPPSQLGLVSRQSDDSADASEIIDSPALGVIGADMFADQSEEELATPETVTPILQEDSIEKGSSDEENSDEAKSDDDDVWPTYSVASSEQDNLIDEPILSREQESMPPAWNTTPTDMPPVPTITNHLEADEVDHDDASESVSGVYEMTETPSVEALSLPQWPTSEEPVSPELAESPALPEWPEETASHLLPKEQIGSHDELDAAEAIQPSYSEPPAALAFTPGEEFTPDNPEVAEFENNAVENNAVENNEFESGELGLNPFQSNHHEADELQKDDSVYEVPVSSAGLDVDASAEPYMPPIDLMQSEELETPYQPEAEFEAEFENGLENGLENEEESIGDRLLREMGIEKKAIDYPIDGSIDEHVDTPANTYQEPAADLNSQFEDNPPHSESSEELGQTAMVSEPMLSQLQQLEASYSDSTKDDSTKDDLPASELPAENSVNMTAQWQPDAMLENAEDSLVGDNSHVATEEPMVNALMSPTGTSDTGSLFSEPEQVTATEEPYMGMDSQSDHDEESHVSDSVAEEASIGGLGEATSAAPTSDDIPAEDDSIEAYMNRLLQRVQGQAEEDGVAAPAQPSAEKSAITSPSPQSEPKVKQDSASPDNSASEMGDVANEGLAEAAKPPAAVSPDAPLVPRSQAPERNSNLSAMRELANESARSAINRSHKSHSHTTRIQAMLKFVYAGVALVCGLVAVAMIDLIMLKCIAVVAALLVAAIFVKEGFTLMNGLMARGQSTSPGPKVEEADVVDAE